MFLFCLGVGGILKMSFEKVFIHVIQPSIYLSFKRLQAIYTCKFHHCVFFYRESLKKCITQKGILVKLFELPKR